MDEVTKTFPSEMQKTKAVIVAALDASRLSKIGKLSVLNEIYWNIKDS